jgi:hypothetical protein
MGMAWTAAQDLAAAFNTRTRFVFHVSSGAGGLLDWLVDRSYAPITAELEKRGFPSMLVHSSVRGSDTPNEDDVGVPTLEHAGLLGEHSALHTRSYLELRRKILKIQRRSNQSQDQSREQQP